MSNTGRTTTVTQGKAPATQTSSQTVTGIIRLLTVPPPSPVRQNTRINVDNGPPPDDNKLKDETVQIIQRIIQNKPKIREPDLYSGE